MEAGEVIPSEFSARRALRCLERTIRRASTSWSGEILVRRQGSGTFVATHSRDRTALSFSPTSSAGKGARNIRRRVAFLPAGEADDATCARLDLKPARASSSSATWRAEGCRGDLSFARHRGGQPATARWPARRWRLQSA